MEIQSRCNMSVAGALQNCTQLLFMQACFLRFFLKMQSDVHMKMKCYAQYEVAISTRSDASLCTEVQEWDDLQEVPHGDGRPRIIVAVPRWDRGRGIQVAGKVTLAASCGGDGNCVITGPVDRPQQVLDQSQPCGRIDQAHLLHQLPDHRRSDRLAHAPTLQLRSTEQRKKSGIRVKSPR